MLRLHCAMGTIMIENHSPKSKSCCLVLALVGNALLLGGLHRFYSKKYLSGLLMFFTLGGFFVWTLIDTIYLICNRFKDGDGKVITIWLL